MSVPPLIRCVGVEKALNGVYEYTGALHGRPCYRQTGLSTGNFVWFCQDAAEGPMWVVTHNTELPGEANENVVARARHGGRWPWEVKLWQVCFLRDDAFMDQPEMEFCLVIPSPELIVQAPAMDGTATTCGFRRSGVVHKRVAFRRIGDSNDPGITSLWIFWMPKQSRWLLANVKPGGTGVQSVVARSLPDDGSTWASLWPWEVEPDGWESPTADTIGLQDADAVWARVSANH
ncbi:DPP8 [Symbiodinium natans]|uniref:DPP8 protein n=1 Tax=Symbiodinium natans TaxID=878477 RepID=A0A812RL94_9DINO|nr:DPP8 [Symbiodinium natans]